MSSETVYCVALFQTDVSENISSLSSGVLRLIGFTVVLLWKLILSLSIEGYY
jgi:hypothetical protein